MSDIWVQKALENAKELRAGEVGYIAASIKSIGDTKVGDTVTLVSNPAKEALAGYRNVNPMVYSGILSRRRCKVRRSA